MASVSDVRATQPTECWIKVDDPPRGQPGGPGQPLVE
jgi:hypothetical protein